MAEIGIGGQLVPMTTEGKGMDAQHVYDSQQNKTQQQINAENSGMPAAVSGLQAQIGSLDAYVRVSEKTITPDHQNIIYTGLDLASGTTLKVTGTAATALGVSSYISLFKSDGTRYDYSLLVASGQTNGNYLFHINENLVNAYLQYTYHDTDTNSINFRLEYSQSLSEQVAELQENTSGLSSGLMFDISEYNAVSETPSQYADLTEALGTNGANVPSNKRKAGMTVKFINSTTGKYEQWRYMSVSTVDFGKVSDITNWQGVSTFPSSGSKNLVEGGGICDFVDEFVDEQLKKINSSLNIASIEFTSGYIDIETGEVVNDDDYVHATVNARYEDMYGIYAFTNSDSIKEIFIEPNDHSAAIPVTDYNPTAAYVPQYDYVAPTGGRLVVNSLHAYAHVLRFVSKDKKLLDETANKTLKLVAFKAAPTNPSVGQYYYAPSKKIYKITRVSSGSVASYDIIPFLDGALYTYDDNVYTWNGTDLVEAYTNTPIDKDIAKGNTDHVTSSDAIGTVLNGFELELLDTWEDGFIRTNTSVIDPTSTEQPENYRHIKVSCVSGDRFVISGVGAAGARLWCFADSENNSLLKSNASVTADCLEITAPTGTSYLVINDARSGSTCYKGKTVSGKIEEVEDSIAKKIVVLTNVHTIPTYHSNAQIGDNYYYSGTVYRKITAVDNSGYPTAWKEIPLSYDVVYVCNSSIYLFNGTTLKKTDVPTHKYSLKVSSISLAPSNSPTEGMPVYPVLWGVKYDNSVNIENGYGQRSHAIPIGWLYYDRNNPTDIYYSSGVADRMIKILTWNSTIADGYLPVNYQPIICKNGDIVCVPRAEYYPSEDSPKSRTKNPIIYAHGDYENPTTVNVSDSTYGIKPVSWFANSGLCFIDDDNSFVFGEYARPDFEPANVWRVEYPYSTPENWSIVLHTSGTGEGVREVEHFHCVNFDPFTSMMYLASGDSATESKIWESEDFGATWSLVYDANGSESRRNRARMLNWIFTKDAAYYGSDQGPYLITICRGNDGKLDFDTIYRLCTFRVSSDDIVIGETYYTCLIDEPYGILCLQRRSGESTNKSAVYFYELCQKWEVGDSVRWVYNNNGTITEVTGTIESTQDGLSGTIFLGAGATATFGEDVETTNGSNVNTKRLMPSDVSEKHFLEEIKSFLPLSTNPNGFRCDAVSVYQSMSEKRIVCGFGLVPNYNDLPGNKTSSPSHLNNLALEVY